ncbi:MAG: 30S ribosomal protein S27ae [Candidatus Micrarchaeia archaeon]|jgi:small subunit ribosomal protein S27Ae
MADDKKKPEAKKVVKKEKKPPKPYKPGKNCPKCGAGVHLAEHKGRRACGKCGYFEKS